MSAFAIAIPLCIFYPELQAGLLILAVSIAVSRVVLGMHFVSDVLWVRCWEPGLATELTNCSGKSRRGILQFLEFNTEHTEKSHRER